MKNIYVGNLDFQTTEEELRKAFEVYGQVDRVNIVTDKPDSSHLLLPQVKGELYYAFAEHDQSVPAHVIPDLKASLAKTDVVSTVKVFDATHHGFCFAERAVYDPQASEQTWADILAMFKRRLG